MAPDAVGLSGLSCAGGGGGEHAERERKNAAYARGAVVLALASRDGVKLAWGLDEVGRAGSKAWREAAAVEGLLRRGLPLLLTLKAIGALGAAGQPAGAAALRPYARHRSVAVRQATMAALGKLKGEALLVAGLDDEDDGVKKQAAEALGASCQSGCEALLGRAGVGSLAVLGPGLVELWARSGPGVDAGVQGRALELLRASSDPEAAALLGQAL